MTVGCKPTRRTPQRTAASCKPGQTTSGNCLFVVGYSLLSRALNALTHFQAKKFAAHIALPVNLLLYRAHPPKNDQGLNSDMDNVRQATARGRPGNVWQETRGQGPAKQLLNPYISARAAQNWDDRLAHCQTLSGPMPRAKRAPQRQATRPHRELAGCYLCSVPPGRESQGLV